RHRTAWPTPFPYTTLFRSDEYGMGGYRSSQNDPWYSDFYAENGRAPRKSEAADLAKTLVDSEIARGGGQFVTSEFAESYKIAQEDRKSTRLNSSHVSISYA